MNTKTVLLLTGLVLGMALAVPEILAQTAGSVNIRTSPKGSTAVGGPTSTAVDANTQALDVSVKGTVTISGTANQGTAAAQSNRWPVFISDGTAERLGQQTMAASLPVAIASNQSALSTTVAAFTSVITGQQAVTSTATVLPTNSAKRVCVKVLIGGSQDVFFGPTGVTTTTGQVLSAGDAWCGTIDNSNRLFVIAAGTGSTVAFDVLN